MLKSVDLNMMMGFISNARPAFDGKFVEIHAKELISTLDERLDSIIYAYCTSNKRKDFSFTQNGETFSVLEIVAMRSCTYYEAIILMDGFIKDAKTGRSRIMRR